MALSNPNKLDLSGLKIKGLPTGYIDPGLIGVKKTPVYGSTNVVTQLPKVTSGKVEGPANQVIKPGSAAAINTDQRDANGLLINSPGALYDRNTGQPLNQPTAPVATPTTPTPGSAAYLYNQVESEADKADRLQREAIQQYQQEQFNQVIDPNQIYQDKLRQYQAEIDNINNMFNDALNNSRTVNAPNYKARLDQNRIGQVLGGIVASPMGEAQTTGIQDANAQEQAAAEAIINERRAQSLASIMGEVRRSSEAELTAKKEAKAKGADSLLEYLNAAPAQRKAKVSKAVKALIAGGHDVSKFTPEELDSWAKGLGISKDELISTYSEEKSAVDSATQKAELESRKANADIAKTEAQTKKELADASQVGKLTPYQSAQLALEREKLDKDSGGAISNIVSVFSPGALIPNSGGVPFIDDNGFATPEGFRTAAKAAQADKITRQDFIKQFGYLIAPGSAAAYGLTPAEIKLVAGELPVAE